MVLVAVGGDGVAALLHLLGYLHLGAQLLANMLIDDGCCCSPGGNGYPVRCGGHLVNAWRWSGPCGVGPLLSDNGFKVDGGAAIDTHESHRFVPRVAGDGEAQRNDISHAPTWLCFAGPLEIQPQGDEPWHETFGAIRTHDGHRVRVVRGMYTHEK